MLEGWKCNIYITFIGYFICLNAVSDEFTDKSKPRCQVFSQYSVFNQWKHMLEIYKVHDITFPTSNAVFAMDCRGRNLESMPSFFPSAINVLLISHNRLTYKKRSKKDTIRLNMTYIDMSDNHLSYLDSDFLESKQLIVFNLDSNFLDYLPKCVFCGTPAIKIISLRQNIIESLHKNAFRNLRYLVLLDLNSNRIFEIDPDWFIDLKSLTVLRLSNNNIKELLEGTFNYLFNLKELDISGNQINVIEYNWFVGIDKLIRLYVQNNHLHDIQSIYITHLKNLDILDCSANPILTLMPHSFNSSSISVLNINSMPHLLLIDERAFYDMSNLMYVDVSHSYKLRYIDVAAFHNSPKLKTLHLHNCNLSTLEEDMVNSISSLIHLTLHHNPFICDCNILWLENNLNAYSFNLTIHERENIACYDFSKSANILLTQFRSEEHCKFCKPRILTIFEPNIESVIGDNVRVPCKAVGKPKPEIDWSQFNKTLSKNTGVPALEYSNQNVTKGKVIISRTGALLIEYMEVRNIGVYTCNAHNYLGKDGKEFSLSMTHMLTHLNMIKSTSNSVTLSWNTVEWNHSYKIVYYKIDSNTTHTSVDISHYMHSYTVNELEADSWYRFCVAVTHGEELPVLNCTDVKTHSLTEKILVIKDYKNLIISCIIILIIFIIVVITLMKKLLNKLNLKFLHKNNHSHCFSETFMYSLNDAMETELNYYEDFEDEGHEEYDKCDELQEMKMPLFKCSVENLTF